MVFYTTGLIILTEAALMLLPLGVGLWYREGESVLAFCLSLVITLFAGGGLTFFSRPRSRVIYAKEGFAITTLAWASLSALGAFPFFLSGQIPDYLDAFFETVSGFTTTGASILENVELLDRSLLFWRSFTHWVGGMGVLVFLMAFLPGITDQSLHIIRAEMPGPVVGKLLPRTRDTAKILYLIYLAMSLVQVILLLISGMSLFDSVVHMFGTAGTGGFGIHSDSAAGFTPLQQWIITVFMLLFGINFNLYYLILIRRFRTAIRSTELHCYGIIVAVATAILCFNSAPLFDSLGESLRHAAFQVSSVISTTGFSTLDFNTLPALSQSVLLLLMFLGACAGSTAGGLKISRFILIAKNCMSEFRYMLHPKSVSVLSFEGKKVEKETQKGVVIYFSLYMICILATYFIISMDGFDIATNFSAAVSCFNNVGPAFGRAFAGYFDYSPLSKAVLSFAMLLGRLEIWPILVTLSPGVWFGKESA